MMRLRWLPSCLLAAALLAGCGSGAAPAKPAAPHASASSASAGTGGQASAAKPSGTAQAPTKLSIGYSAISAEYTPLFVAHDAGFFAKNGLDVTLHLLRGSASAAPTLVSGAVQIDTSEANAALAAMGKGLPVVFLASDLNVYSLQLWAKPSIHSVADLKGKALGLSSPGSLTDSAARELLTRFRVNPSQVHLDFLGGTPTRVAALIAGRVDAIIVSPPQGLRAQQAGFKMLYNLARLPHVTNGLLAEKAFVQQHPAEVRAFLKGYLQAIAYTKNPANKTKVLAIMGKYTDIKEQNLLSEAYRYFLPLWQSNPAIPTASLAQSEAWVVGHGGTKFDLARAVDAAPLLAAEKSAGA